MTIFIKPNPLGDPMTEKNPKVQYRRLILIYSLAIIKPGSILALMVFHGINTGEYQSERKNEG